MTRFYPVFLSALILFFVLFPHGAEAKKKGKKDKSPPKSFAAQIKNHTVLDGLFTLYQNKKNGKTLMAISESQIDKEYIYFTQTLNGVLEARHFRGAYRDNRVISIRKHHNKIEFVSENTSFYYDPNNALYRSKEANISPSILATVEIKATEKKETKKRYLIDITDSILSETFTQIKASPPAKAKKGAFSLGKLSKKKSKIHKLKNYPNNTDFVIDYVYNNPAPKNYGRAEVTDARNVTIRVNHSLIEMPKNDYKPRLDDFRVGYFMRKKDDMTSTSHTPYRDLINRWHLKKKNPKAKLSEPVEPIVWWMENTTPKEFRAEIKKGVLAWNKAFEKAGFRNAIVVKQQPDDAKWDAGDIRYNVLRWTSSPTPPFGGYGPSFTNPRTGQIIGADIMLEFVYLTNRVKYQDLVNQLPNVESEPSDSDPKRCHFSHHMQYNTMMGVAALEASGASQVEMTRLVKEGLHHLVLHEVGHTLGLNHNMKASSMVHLDELHDMELANKRGLVGSVMDYTPLNLALPGQKQGKFYGERPGDYDLWAIEFGYHPSLSDPKKEKDRVKKLLSRSVESKHTFGNDADDMRSSRRGIDPRVNIGDLSSDGIGWTKQRFQVIDHLTDSIQTKLQKPGESYQSLVNMYSILLRMKGGAARIASRFIGGVYVERGTTDQFSEGRRPFTPVSLTDQRRAMKVIAENIFSPKAFQTSKLMYQHLQRQRRNFDFFSGPEDPKIHAKVLSIQKRTLDHLLHPNTLQRLSDSRLYGNKYSVYKMMGELTNAIFNGDRLGSTNGFRQNLQLEYTKRLLKIAEKNSSFDSMSKSAAAKNLRRIKGKTAPWFFGMYCGNAETRSHRKYLRQLIKDQ